MARWSRSARPGDRRFQPRWSANNKMDAVLRLLRGEPLDQLSRELEVEAHRLAAWRDDFLEHGKQGLKASPVARGDATERRLNLNPSFLFPWGG